VLPLWIDNRDRPIPRLSRPFVNTSDQTVYITAIATSARTPCQSRVKGKCPGSQSFAGRRRSRLPSGTSASGRLYFFRRWAARLVTHAV